MNTSLTPEQWQRFVTAAQPLEAAAAKRLGMSTPKFEPSIYNKSTIAYWIRQGRSPEGAAEEMIGPGRWQRESQAS